LFHRRLSVPDVGDLMPFHCALVDTRKKTQAAISFSPSSGLSILYKLLQNITQVEEAAQSFYQMYFTDILQHVFSVGTDTSHTAGE